MKIQSPWMGRVRGSAGNMTGSKVYDKNVLRAKAFEVSNPNTTAQQTERSFFTELSQLVGTFSEAQLRTLFPQKPKAMSRRNALTKQIAVSYEIDGTTKSIDFANIITLGNAPEMDFGTTNVSLGGGGAYIELDNSVKTNQQYAENDFIIVLINETLCEVLLTTETASVETGAFGLTTPPSWTSGDSVHAIPLITNSKEGAIKTEGFGSIKVIARPTSKN